MGFKNLYTLNLDLKKAMPNPTPIFMSNDTATLNVIVTDNGNTYDISSAERYVFVFRRIDGVVVANDGTYVNGMATCNLGSTEMALSGDLDCTVQIFLSNTRISTRPFKVKIISDYENGIESTQDYSLLQNLITQVNTATTNADNATTAANNAATNANNAASYATQKGNDAYSYATTNTDASVNSTKMNYLAPVSTYSAIATTYTSPSTGDTVQTTDTNDWYRYDGSTWKNIFNLNLTGYTPISTTNIIDAAKADIVRNSIPSGVLDYNATILSTANSVTSGQIQVPPPNNLNYFSDPKNIISLGVSSFYLNGYKISLGNAQNITLSSPPTFGTRDDLVFLEAWFSTSNPYQLSWRIRVVGGVDFNAHPSGLRLYSEPWDTKVVLPQGGGTVPTSTYPFTQPNTTDTPYFSNNSDKGLFIAGDGSQTAKNNLLTFDGYVYAIPLFRVKRRNNGGYRVDNPNGARDYLSTNVTSSYTLTTGGQTVTISVSSSSGFQVGDILDRNGVPKSFVITAIPSSTQLTITNIYGNNVSVDSATSSTLSLSTATPMTNGMRPDGLYSNIIDAEDIIDLRHQVSLTGFDKQFLLKSQFDKFMRAELRSNVKYTMQKEKWNLKKAPFGIVQQLQPVNVVGNDAVSRSLVNMMGTIGSAVNNPSMSNMFQRTSGSLSVDNSIWYKVSTPASVSSQYFYNSGFTTPIALKGGQYYLVSARVKSDNPNNNQIKLANYANTNDNYPPTSSGNSGIYSSSGNEQTLYLLLNPASDVTNYMGIAYQKYTSGDTTTYYEYTGVRVYQIDQATYNNINTGATGFATATDIANKFPYVDSYPNFAENVLPDFTNSGWTIASQATVTSPYQLTLNGTALYQTSSISVPVVGGTPYEFSMVSTSGLAIEAHDSSGAIISTLYNANYSSPLVLSTPSNAATLLIKLFNNTATGTFTFSNLMLEKVNTGISYPNPFVPFGRWFLQQDQFNPQLGGQNTILHNQNTLGGAFNGLRSNFSDAQISQTVVDVVESNGYSAQKHIVATQATKGQWAVNDTVKINNYYGVLDGVIDSDTALATITADQTANSTTLTVNDVSKLAVNDTFRTFNGSNGYVSTNTYTISAIDTTNKVITFSPALGENVWEGSCFIVETTASSSSPTVTDSAGNTVAGTWSGLGTKTATFTITTAPSTNTTNLTITYSVSYPTGQGFSYLPLQSSDVLQASVNGDMLHSANTVSVKANFVGKVYGNTDLNPHILKYVHSTSLLAPSDANFSEQVQSYINSVMSLDGTTTSNGSINTAGQYAEHLFQFNLIRAIEDKFGEIPADGTANKINWIKNNLSNVAIAWYAYGSSPSGNRASLAWWNTSNSSWTTGWNGWNNTANSPTLVSVGLSSYYMNNAIDSNGMLNLVGYADPAGTVANPTVAPTLSASANSGSTLPAGTYYVVYTWGTTNGETMVSPEASFTITSGQNLVVTVPTLPFGVVQANVYISTAAGTETYQGFTSSTTYNQYSALGSGHAMPGSNAAVVNSTIYTDYVELQITLNTAETGFTVLQSDNPFPALSQNLLNRNLAFPIDTSGFATQGSGTTLTVNGLNSLKVTTPGANTNEGVYIPYSNIAVQPNTRYTWSVLLSGSGTFKMKPTNPSGTSLGMSATYTLTSTPTLYTLTFTTLSNDTNVNLYINTDSTVQAITFYVSSNSLVQSPVATPWTSGRNKTFILNYLGKVAGSTAENPNRLLSKASSSLSDSPTATGVWYTNFAQSVYDQMSKVDGILLSDVASGAGQYIQHMYEFDLSHLGMSLTELKNALRSLTVNWTGYGSGDSTYVTEPTTAPTLSTATTGGALAAGTYIVAYTWKTSSGETKRSPESTITIPAGTTTNTIAVSIPGLPTNVTSANIYITAVGGATGTETLQGNTATSSYTQTVALVTGASLPASNTTGGTLTNGAMMQRWDATTNAWGTNSNMTNTSSSPSTITYTEGIPSEVISSSQKLYYLVYSTYPASATNPSNIYTDYISLQVGLADYVDYRKSNIVKIRPSTMEIKTMFRTKSNRYTGGSGMAQEDIIDLWYKHVPVYPNNVVSNWQNVTILAESDGILASDLGSNMGAIQGTHQYQNPLYRVGNDQQTTFGQFGFVRLDWSEDSRDANTGSQVQIGGYGFANNVTLQNTLTFVKKPIVGTMRWIVLTQTGELQLLVMSAYSTNGTIDNSNPGSSGSKSIQLIPIQGRPLVKDAQGALRSTINPTQWKTKESTILV